MGALLLTVCMSQLRGYLAGSQRESVAGPLSAIEKLEVVKWTRVSNKWCALRMQMGYNGNKAVVICSINGTLASSQDGSVNIQGCASGYVCAPLSAAEVQAQSRFVPAMAGMAGVQPLLHYLSHMLCPLRNIAWE